MSHVDRNGRPLRESDCVIAPSDRGEMVHGWIRELLASGDVLVVFGTCGTPPMSGVNAEDWDYADAGKAVFSSRCLTYCGGTSA